jgi:hypothetical protein
MSATPPEGDLPDEFRKLGQNLKAALKSAWTSEEGRRLQRELQTGLAALQTGLSEAATELTAGPTGQQLRAEMEDLGQRLRSRQVESAVKSELLSALRAVNAELQKAAQPRAGDRPPDEPAE